MDKPCIVCQENCPVSPKAIFTREVFSTVRTSVPLAVKSTDRSRLLLAADALDAGRFGTGDYHALLPDGLRLRIAANSRDALELERPLTEPESPAPGSTVVIQVRLQQPYVDPKLCIGCGVCEHECPVLGRRAIRVTAENESRHPHHRMVL
jgi:Pyruvate/2-oxoacid:ferredoxin oxidoreductase delta subunit